MPNVPTTDVIIAANIQYSGALSVGPFNDPTVQTFCGCFGQFFLGDIHTNELSIIYSVPAPPNLYVGGPITDGFINLCGVFGCDVEVANKLSGSLTAVPGPTIGAGLPGLIFAGGGLLAWWRSKRRAQDVGLAVS